MTATGRKQRLFDGRLSVTARVAEQVYQLCKKAVGALMGSNARQMPYPARIAEPCACPAAHRLACQMSRSIDEKRYVSGRLLAVFRTIVG
ncbi:hypothetical protein DBV39_14295 [Orrella marina]|uniref:Uncharacterized protein n=1 Tax=Orrella marina TaxID=2163011 RepID=A0A2R4XLP9_9BURK|nr:hypothetical protein DBV39_14295 [Orrella marina]